MLAQITARISQNC